MAFIGLDSDAFGDGDAHAQPGDAWLQWQLIENGARLANTGWGVSRSKMNQDSDDLTTLVGLRPYLSTEWATVEQGWAVVCPGQLGLRLRMHYHAQTPDGSDAGDIELRLVVFDGAPIQKYTLAGTYSAGTLTGTGNFLHEFEQPADRYTAVRFEVQVRSVIDTEVTTTMGSSSAIGLAMAHVLGEGTGAAAFFYDDTLTSPPTNDARECTYLKLSAAAQGLFTQAQNEPVFDLLHTSDTNIATYDTHAQTLQSIPAASGVGDSTGELFVGPCFWVRAWSMEPYWGDEDLWYVAPQDRVLSNQPMYANELAGLTALVHQIARRWRLAAWGPHGQYDYDNNNADHDPFRNNGYAAHWPFVMGDYTNTAGDENDVIDSSFYLTSDNPVLELRLYWVCVEHGATANIDDDVALERVGKNGQGLAIKDKEKAPFTNDPGRATWSLNLTVQQMVDKVGGGATWLNDSTAHANRTDTLPIDVYPASVVNQLGDPGDRPLLRGVDVLKNDRAKSTNKIGFWFKEGSTFRAYKDHRCLRETVHSLETSSVNSTVIDRPFRLRVKATLDTWDDKLNPANTNESLRLMLVGYTVVEKPDV